jgi:ParB-like chromosome segregation protein Spo0J
MEKSINALLPSPDLEDIQKSWPLTDYEYQSLKDDIKAHGIRHPVLIYEDGGQLYILAGFHRHKIAREIGLDTVPVEYYAGADTRDARRQYAILENMARRQVTTETKKALAKIYLEGNPRASDRVIGKITGLDGKTIAQVRAEMVRRAEIPHVVKRADTRGRQQPATKPKRETPPTAAPAVTPARIPTDPAPVILDARTRDYIKKYVSSFKGADRKKAINRLIQYLKTL